MLFKSPTTSCRTQSCIYNTSMVPFTYTLTKKSHIIWVYGINLARWNEVVFTVCNREDSVCMIIKLYEKEKRQGVNLQVEMRSSLKSGSHLPYNGIRMIRISIRRRCFWKSMPVTKLFPKIKHLRELLNGYFPIMRATYHLLSNESQTSGIWIYPAWMLGFLWQWLTLVY